MKKHRWCGWDSNPRPHETKDGSHRQIHRAEAALIGVIPLTLDKQNLSHFKRNFKPDVCMNGRWHNPFLVRLFLQSHGLGT